MLDGRVNQPRLTFDIDIIQHQHPLSPLLLSRHRHLRITLPTMTRPPISRVLASTSLLQPIASSSRLPPLSRGLASHAYHQPTGPLTPTTSSTPTDLTPEQRTLLERTIRVDQAGELGANWIYRGQKLVMDVMGDKATAKQVEVRGVRLSSV